MAKKVNAIEVNAIEVTAPVFTVAELMAQTAIAFESAQTVKVITSDLQEYLKMYSVELQKRARELGKGCGGRILDEVTAKFYAVTSKGLSKADLSAILITANCGRSDVSGYCNTFSASALNSARQGCPSRVQRFKVDGLYCVKAIASV